MNKASATSRSAAIRVAQTDEPGCAPVGHVPARRIADIAELRPGDIRASRVYAEIR